MQSKQIILASSSPRRQQILENAGLKFSIVASEFEEDNSLDMPPLELVKHLSLGKAKSVYASHPGSIVIGVDTLISSDGLILGKPGSEEGIIKSLNSLNGKTHSALTGFTIISDKQTISEAVETKVTLRHLSIDEINAYAKTHEGIDKAGGYAIQSRGALLVERIEGDYWNIVGLPLSRLAVRLREFGITIL